MRPFLQVMFGPTYAAVGAVTLMALAICVLTGWHFDIMVLKTVWPGLNSMKVNTALALLFAGISILCITKVTKARAVKWVGLACAGVVGLIGSLSAFEYVTGTNLGIDELIYADPASYGTGVVPGQMSIITAIMLCIGSAGLFAAYSRSELGHRVFLVTTTFGLISSFLLLNLFF